MDNRAAAQNHDTPHNLEAIAAHRGGQSGQRAGTIQESAAYHGNPHWPRITDQLYHVLNPFRLSYQSESRLFMHLNHGTPRTTTLLGCHRPCTNPHSFRCKAPNLNINKQTNCLLEQESSCETTIYLLPSPSGVSPSKRCVCPGLSPPASSRLNCAH